MAESFVIAPAGTRPLWLLIPVGLLLLVVFSVLLLSLRGGTSARFDVSPAGLRLRGDLYGRLVPASALTVAEARRANPATEPALRPRFRTLGTGLPGYQAGWFRLGNGEKALVYLTDPARAVYIPTSAGYSVLVSPTDPDRFLSALKRLPEPGAAR
jgi:hypothetical protein